MLQIAWEAINRVEVWQIAGGLFVLSIIMQRIINKFPIVCQSVYVVHVPWGILWTTVFAYLGGLITYAQMLQLAVLYLAAYPFMWWTNYKFTQVIVKIFKDYRISKRTTGIRIWANEPFNEDLPGDNVNTAGSCFNHHMAATRRVSNRYRRDYSRRHS